MPSFLSEIHARGLMSMAMDDEACAHYGEPVDKCFQLFLYFDAALALGGRLVEIGRWLKV